MLSASSASGSVGASSCHQWCRGSLLQRVGVLGSSAPATLPYCTTPQPCRPPRYAMTVPGPLWGMAALQYRWILLCRAALSGWQLLHLYCLSPAGMQRDLLCASLAFSPIFAKLRVIADCLRVARLASGRHGWGGWQVRRESKAGRSLLHAEACEGFSGRTLCKLTFLAHAGSPCQPTTHDPCQCLSMHAPWPGYCGIPPFPADMTCHH